MESIIKNTVFELNQQKIIFKLWRITSPKAWKLDPTLGTRWCFTRQVLLGLLVSSNSCPWTQGHHDSTPSGDLAIPCSYEADGVPQRQRAAH